MEKKFYNAQTLRERLAGFEADYGISSGEFFQMHKLDRVTVKISGFNRHVWAVTYDDAIRMGALTPRPRTADTLGLTA